MPPDSSGADPPVVTFDDFRLDRRLRSLHRAAQQIPLSPKPFATLEFLIENRHRVVPKAELLERVWGGQREISTVEHAVGQIRRVLGDDLAEPRYIATVPGQGYRFIAEIHGQEPPSPGISAPGRRRALLLVAGAVLVLLTGFAAIRLFHPPPRVARVEVNGTTLVARSAIGDVLWTHELDAPLVEASEEPVQQSQIVDLDGDGLPEVLLAATFASAPKGPRDLFCFSSAGKLLWHYSPAVDARFNTPDLDGPWRLLDVLLVPGKRSATIWTAVVHDVWWPSAVVRLSAAGAAERVFTSSGDIRKLRRIQNKDGSYILAAGVNNEYRRASLAILSESAPPSTSPQTRGSGYQCIDGCPDARPYRYILLPRSELNMASDEPYNIGTLVRLRSGGITVETRETRTMDAFYDFSQDLQPERVAYGSNYRQIHERFEREGRIKHTFANCPERKTGAILRICDQNGNWSEVTIPRLPSN